ncbi:hypothetical protein VNO77_23271 [Canavalia gladiata]|uniref:Uncharacterized protein n=1 Tax=Canavalia gladiata TaxID=3824 RepID=A0AAN9L453_CANGL
MYMFVLFACVYAGYVNTYFRRESAFDHVKAEKQTRRNLADYVMQDYTCLLLYMIVSALSQIFSLQYSYILRCDFLLSLLRRRIVVMVCLWCYAHVYFNLLICNAAKDCPCIVNGLLGYNMVQILWFGISLTNPAS